jgi:2-oxoisovalerate dehydrogenase E1 component alpha subunit
VKSLLVREYKVKPAIFDEVGGEAETLALKLRTDVLAMGRPDPMSMFEHAYSTTHPLIEEGRQEMIDLGIGVATP